MAIIEAIAAVESVAPTKLGPLYDEIDPELIDKLFAGKNDASKCFRFNVSGWNVFLRGDGAIRVCDPDQQTDPAPAFAKPLPD